MTIAVGRGSGGVGQGAHIAHAVVIMVEAAGVERFFHSLDSIT